MVLLLGLVFIHEGMCQLVEVIVNWCYDHRKISSLNQVLLLILKISRALIFAKRVLVLKGSGIHIELTSYFFLL